MPNPPRAPVLGPRFLSLPILGLGCLIVLLPGFPATRETRDPQAGSGPVQALEAALARYQDLVTRGGWRIVDSGAALKPLTADPRVPALRERLVAEGYPAGATPPDSGLYDSGLEASVRRFQSLHGLEEDGIVGPATLEALNVTAEARVRQIASNLERRRAIADSLGDRYILENSAAFMLEVVDSGRVIMRLRTIVGRPDWPTPVVSSRITELIFRPLWRVPRSIAVEEVLRLVRRDSSYLRRNAMGVFRNSADGYGDEVNPDSVDWSRVTRRNFVYQFVQEPGPSNPLGGVKFVLRTPFDVYLHGTSAPGLFDRRRRTLSHGCVRVDEVERLASYLLPAWSMDSIRAAMTTGRERSVGLEAPIPVHLVYWTAWSEGDGPMAFRDDVYHLDR